MGGTPKLCTERIAYSMDATFLSLDHPPEMSFSNSHRGKCCARHALLPQSRASSQAFSETSIPVLSSWLI